VKLSLRVFKQGKPIYWVIGGVVIFVLFYLMFRGKSAPATGTTTYATTGPSEALQAQQLAAGIATQQASLAAGVQVQGLQEQQNVAAMALTASLANIDAGRVVSLAGIDAQKAADAENASANIQINRDNLSYTLDTAQVAANTQIGIATINANEVNHQLDTNAAMFADQLKQLTAGQLIEATLVEHHKQATINEYAPIIGSAVASIGTSVIPSNPTLH
jgi:hypothetical protein